LRAYLMTGPGEIGLADVADPLCKSDQILVATEAVSICSTDVSYFRGHLSPEQWPIVPGHEYVGRVVDVGINCVAPVSPGDRITYWGQTDFDGLAEFRCITPIFPVRRDEAIETGWYTRRGFLDANQAATIRLPAGLPADQATLIEPVTSVLRSILLNLPRPGDVAVVLGCGPTGLIAAQLLRRCYGISYLVALDTDPSRRAVAAESGADLVLDPVTEREALEQLAEEHHGAVADYVFDTLPYVDGASDSGVVRSAAMRMLRAEGRYIVFGATDKPQSFDHWLMLAKGLQVQAAPFDVRAFPMSRTAHVMRVAAELLSSGLLDVSRLVTGDIAFCDESAVRRVFTHYGQGGSLRTSIRFGGADSGLAELAGLARPEHDAALAR
jgi:L-gulonate 5-dehydrogenase